MEYNKAGVKAIEKVEAMIAALDLPLEIAGKFNAIINAIERQIEDYEYTEETVKALDKALLILASKYAPQAQYLGLECALAEFERRLTKRQ